MFEPMTGTGMRLAAAVAVALAMAPMQSLGQEAPSPEAPALEEQPVEGPGQRRPEGPTQPLDQPAPDIRKLLGELYERLRAAPDEATASAVAEAIEKVWLRSGSDTVDLLMNRAMTLMREEELDLALKLLDTVVTLDPKFAEGWNQRATVHFLKQDYRGSMQDLRYVLHLDPRHFKAINGMALILQELGNKEAALKAFRKALEVHPFLDDARQAIRELTREVEGQGI